MGGFVAQYKGWRWTQWCMIFVGIFVFALAIPSKETYKPVILRRRTKKLGLALDQQEKSTETKFLDTFVQNFLRPLYMLVSEVRQF